MPVISITMGPSTEEQKKMLIERLTADAMDITHIGAEHFTVLLNELPYENLGVGGRTVKEIRAGK
ncbi:MAG: tautomerase family protein [Deltaproteobacteria bacterium]|nr:tautomerase family protein [Deltaproteobacteria bacterium]